MIIKRAKILFYIDMRVWPSPGCGNVMFTTRGSVMRRRIGELGISMDQRYIELSAVARTERPDYEKNIVVLTKRQRGRVEELLAQVDGLDLSLGPWDRLVGRRTNALSRQLEALTRLNGELETALREFGPGGTNRSYRQLSQIKNGTAAGNASAVKATAENGDCGNGKVKTRPIPTHTLAEALEDTVHKAGLAFVGGGGIEDRITKAFVSLKNMRQMSIVKTFEKLNEEDRRLELLGLMIRRRGITMSRKDFRCALELCNVRVEDMAGNGDWKLMYKAEDGTVTRTMMSGDHSHREIGPHYSLPVISRLLGKSSGGRGFETASVC